MLQGQVGELAEPITSDLVDNIIFEEMQQVIQHCSRIIRSALLDRLST